VLWITAPSPSSFLTDAATKGSQEGSEIAGRQFIRSASMCDYSLHAVANRPAELAETLVSTKFPNTTTRGFAAPDNPNMAVCLRPGTELAFEDDVQTDGVVFRKKVRDRLARFRRIRADEPHQHHDALEFSNGTIVLLTDLVAGQRATVLQLPAKPMEEKPGISAPATFGRRLTEA
jgi:hypothetical protein